MTDAENGRRRPQPLRLGITLGDVNGIGPEIAVRALDRYHPADVHWILIGDRRVVDRATRAFGSSSLPAWEPGGGAPPPVGVWAPAGPASLEVQPGKVTAEAGAASALWVDAAVEACRSGALNGFVSAPICKQSWSLAGIHHPGHTERIAELAGVSRFAMMLLGGPLRVVLATRHVPLRDVVSHLEQGALVETIRLTCEALPWLGHAGRVAVCGVNPHAGDGGVLGDEERRVIAPAIAEARRGGAAVEGPVPGDVAFHLAAGGAFAAVVAMYHDQGLAPLKLLAFATGVNLTLGLPWVRTSPDHGTAFDRAWHGGADIRSMSAAMDLAVDLARRGSPWR